MSKYICETRRCGWRGQEGQILKGPNPFDAEETVYGCPDCKCVGTLIGACEIEGCWQESTCGFPTPEGYLRTCGKHSRGHPVNQKE